MDRPGVRLWLGPALIVLCACAAYASSFAGTFQFDDIPAILDNPTLRRLWPPWAPLSPPSGALTVSGRPILNLSFAFNYAISGYRPWSYHLMNGAIHAAAALVLFGLVRRTLAILNVSRANSTGPANGAVVSTGDYSRARRRGPTSDGADLPALAVAILWAVHPVNTESVTYIVQRAESLMGLFYLLTLYCFLRSVEGSVARDDQPPSREGFLPRTETGVRGAETGGRALIWVVLAVIASALGMATKEVMVTAPVVVLLYDRIFIARGWSTALKARKGVYLALAATWIPLFALVAANGWDRGATSGFHVGVRWLSYWLSQGEAVFRYLGLSLWPSSLAIEYGPPLVKGVAAIALFSVVCLAMAATAVGCIRGRTWAFLPAVCFLVLLPTSVMPGVLQFAAEHRMYLPLAAVVTGAVIAARALALRWTALPVRRRSFGLVFACAAVSVCLGVETALRNRVYASELALWTDSISKYPLSALAQQNVGHALLVSGRTDEAIPFCEASLRLDPTKPTAHYNLALAYEEKKRWDDALREFAAAALINPKLYYAQCGAGRLLNRAGKPAEAEAYLRRALSEQPDYAQAHANLGVALNAQGRTREAISEFETSLRQDPDQPDVEFDLGLALDRTGRGGEALGHYSAAVRLKPEFGDAQLNLGVGLAEAGRLQEALTALQTAVRLLPESAEAHGNLATVLDQLGKTDLAIAEYRAALRLKSDYAEAHYNLGNALLRVRDVTGARAEFGEAVRLKPEFGAARQMLDRLNSLPGLR
jgi:tetratricopeptide (TPR) repeat protein